MYQSFLNNVKLAKPGEFIISKEKNDFFSFEFFLDDEMILKSGNYKTKASAKNGIEAIYKNANDERQYYIEEDGENGFVFYIKAANGQPIVKSKNFKTMIDVNETIQIISAIVDNSKVKDSTVKKKSKK